MLQKKQPPKRSRAVGKVPGPEAVVNTLDDDGAEVQEKQQRKTRRDDVSSLPQCVAVLVLIFVKGFDALLEPFYQGKSLTEPIDTARVCVFFDSDFLY